MRQNLPITNSETVIREDQYLISKTDRKGRITYANPAFVEVSGFSYEELIGQPHNLVRHPDMPLDAFKDLWNTLKSGESWLGLVKNRRKDGGFYWVLASVTPIVEHGEITGYASVRVKPSEQQIRDAETFYQQINAGQPGGYTIQKGSKTPAGWRHALSLLSAPFKPTISASLFRLACGFLLLALAAWATGQGMLSSALPDSVSLLLLVVVATALCLYGWRIARHIQRPLRDIAFITRQISAGNLAVTIPAGARDDTGPLYFYLDLMRKSLMDISVNVNAGVESAVQTADELGRSNAQLEQRTHAQAASLNQTMSRMEQFSASVRRNTEDALRAGQLADAGIQTAQRGKDAVAQAIDAMQGIRDSANKISEITDMIEAIAFQTNILALNAAVESARAGEAGRGFAVVAGEVRSLAHKSSEAAREIEALIAETVNRILQGDEQVRAAGQTMQDIMQSVEATTQVMNRISSASVEQSDGLGQIQSAIGHMDAGTQENHRLVQELGFVARRLVQDSFNLKRTIEVLASSAKQQSVPSMAMTSRKSSRERSLAVVSATG